MAYMQIRHFGMKSPRDLVAYVQIRHFGMKSPERPYGVRADRPFCHNTSVQY